MHSEMTAVMLFCQTLDWMSRRNCWICSAVKRGGGVGAWAGRESGGVVGRGAAAELFGGLLISSLTDGGGGGVLRIDRTARTPPTTRTAKAVPISSLTVRCFCWISAAMAPADVGTA